MSRVLVVPAVIAGLLSLSMPVVGSGRLGVARVEGLAGEAMFRVGGAPWQPLDGPVDLSSGGELRTGPAGEALVTLPGASTVRVAPGSELRVGGVDEEGAAVVLSQGRLFASVADGSLTVAGPGGHAVSGEGQFAMQARPTGSSLDVLVGEVRFSGERVALGDGSVRSGSMDVPPGVRVVALNDSTWSDIEGSTSYGTEAEAQARMEALQDQNPGKQYRIQQAQDGTFAVQEQVAAAPVTGEGGSTPGQTPSGGTPPGGTPPGGTPPVVTAPPFPVVGMAAGVAAAAVIGVLVSQAAQVTSE